MALKRLYDIRDEAAFGIVALLLYTACRHCTAKLNSTFIYTTGILDCAWYAAPLPF